MHLKNILCTTVANAALLLNTTINTFRYTLTQAVVSGQYIKMAQRRQVSQVPPQLRWTFALDAYCTNKLVKLVETVLSPKQLRVQYKLLEISCSGILWLAMSFVLIWFHSDKTLHQMQINFLIGLLLDIILVSVLKIVIKRKRPAVNNDPFAMGPGKYSFPCGYGSRSAFITYFLSSVADLWPISLINTEFLLVWSFLVCMSRVLMRRHHFLDVVAGVILGIFEGILIINCIYLEQETSIDLISWIQNSD